MGVQKGDFIGFTFDGIHSSELGLIRVSDGSRYTDNLLPSIQDKVVQVPGGDGSYYFGSYYTNKQISFPVAFDSLTDSQLRKIKQIFGDKKIHTLIFDETPYKVYKVKATGSPSLKYICFDEVECCHNTSEKIANKNSLYNVDSASSFKRVYKGDGTLSFTAYTPFALSRFKYRDEYTAQNIPEWGALGANSISNIYYNIDEWLESSKIIPSYSKTTLNTLDYVLDKPTNGGVAIYNPGDFPTHFKLTFMLKNDGLHFPGARIYGIEEGQELVLEEFDLKQRDKGIQINTKLNLIEGIDENKNPTGIVYNRYISEGDFFKIPVTDEIQVMQFALEKPLSDNSINIDYNYLFF